MKNDEKDKRQMKEMERTRWCEAKGNALGGNKTQSRASGIPAELIENREGR